MKTESRKIVIKKNGMIVGVQGGDQDEEMADLVRATVMVAMTLGISKRKLLRMIKNRWGRIW